LPQLLGDSQGSDELILGSKRKELRQHGGIRVIRRFEQVRSAKVCRGDLSFFQQDVSAGT
jgi:hypothetical protein